MIGALMCGYLSGCLFMLVLHARYGNPRADQLERELADCQRNAQSAELQHADESKRFSAATLRDQIKAAEGDAVWPVIDWPKWEPGKTPEKEAVNEQRQADQITVPGAVAAEAAGTGAE
jgi:hypothetical protein